MQSPDNLVLPDVSLLSFLPVVLIGLYYLAILTAPVAVVVLIVRFMRAYERRTQAIAGEHKGHVRVDALEAQIEQVRAELDRVHEGQRFTNQLLSQRGPNLAASTTAAEPNAT